MVGDRMEQTNNHHSGNTRVPPLLLAKRYIRSQTSVQENVDEGQVCPNSQISCKGRRLKRVRRVYKGEGLAKEYPTLTKFDYDTDPGGDERSEDRKKTRSLKDLYASTEEIVLE